MKLSRIPLVLVMVLTFLVLAFAATHTASLTVEVLVESGILLGGESNQAMDLSIVQAQTGISDRSIRIQYALAKTEQVALSACDARGRLVETLASQQQGPGKHSVEWKPLAGNGKRTGLFFVVLTAGTERHVRKLALVK